MAILEPQDWAYVDSNDRALEIALETRVSTIQGTRIGRPGYGNNADEILARPFGDIEEAQLREQVRIAANPLIDIQSIAIEAIPITTTEGETLLDVKATINGNFDVVIQTP